MNYKDLYNPCELVEWSKIYQSFQNATERAAFAMEKFGRNYEEMTKVMENMRKDAPDSQD